MGGAVSADGGTRGGTRGGESLTRFDWPSAVREGLLAGVLGAVAVALLYAAVDLWQGVPLRTPAALHALALRGVEAAQGVQPSAGPVLAFTALHVAVWSLAGTGASILAAVSDAHPRSAWMAGAALVAAFASTLTVAGAAELPQLALSLWSGTLLGSAVLAGTLLWRHPGLWRPAMRARLTRTTRQHLVDVLAEECRCRALYRRAELEYGGLEGVADVLAEKDRAVGALLELLDRYELAPPPEVWEEQADLPAGLRGVWERALARERALEETYAAALASVDEEPVRAVFLRRQSAQTRSVLPAL